MGMLVAMALLFITLGSTIPEETLDITIINPVVEEKNEVVQLVTSTPTPKKPTIHIVESGDTLQKIANNYYGDTKYWTVLWNDNNWIEDFRVIQTGWELALRDVEPTNVELDEKLAIVYEELTAPTPTPTSEPHDTQLAETRAIGAAGTFEEVYKQAGLSFGIPWEILYGLHMVETGLRDGPISNGTGPQGPLQFMPGTWAVYGIDGNGDGNADINNAVDAIHGAANYLATHGGVEAGLQSYGHVIDKVYSVARSRGWGG